MAKTSQLDSPAILPVSPSTNPSGSCTYNGVKGPDLETRTSSPNGNKEVTIVKLPDSGAKMTIL